MRANAFRFACLFIVFAFMADNAYSYVKVGFDRLSRVQSYSEFQAVVDIIWNGAPIPEGDLAAAARGQAVSMLYRLDMFGPDRDVKEKFGTKPFREFMKDYRPVVREVEEIFRPTGELQLFQFRSRSMSDLARDRGISHRDLNDVIGAHVQEQRYFLGYDVCQAFLRYAHLLLTDNPSRILDQSFFLLLGASRHHQAAFDQMIQKGKCQKATAGYGSTNEEIELTQADIDLLQGRIENREFGDPSSPSYKFWVGLRLFWDSVSARDAKMEAGFDDDQVKPFVDGFRGLFSSSLLDEHGVGNLFSWVDSSRWKLDDSLLKRVQSKDGQVAVLSLSAIDSELLYDRVSFVQTNTSLGILFQSPTMMMSRMGFAECILLFRGEDVQIRAMSGSLEDLQADNEASQLLEALGQSNPRLIPTSNVAGDLRDLAKRIVRLRYFDEPLSIVTQSLLSGRAIATIESWKAIEKRGVDQKRFRMKTPVAVSETEDEIVFESEFSLVASAFGIDKNISGKIKVIFKFDSNENLWRVDSIEN